MSNKSVAMARISRYSLIIEFITTSVSPLIHPFLLLAVYVIHFRENKNCLNISGRKNEMNTFLNRK